MGWSTIPGAMATTVLIADHHPSLRSVARMLLETEGYEVVGEAPDGEAALALAQRLKPDVVLLDLGLPGIDGVEVARRLPPGPAIVLVSSRDARDIGPLAEPVKSFIAKGELFGHRRAARGRQPARAWHDRASTDPMRS